MCGIAGIVEPERESPPALAELRRMLGHLRRRGPDGEGEMSRPGACIGHRRLAIIDLTEAARQPFPDESGSAWCAVNGEIYNHVELRRELELKGHVFRSRCDSEVVVHLYEEHGVDLTNRLEGMFALAVWDESRRRLLLARDRFGEKPVYWNETDGRITFASTIEALLAARHVPNEPDPVALDQFLTWRFVPAPGTGFRGIAKLPAGHRLVWERGRSTLHRWWAPPEPDGRGGAEDPRPPSTRLRELLGASVRARLESDVPLGLLLSGGLDSSVIAVEMARVLGGDLHTFSAGFEETDYDESELAAHVARRVGSRHHPVRIAPDVAESLPRLVLRYGEPFADSSALAVEAVARAVRPHVRVVLGGDGGDEVFGGYDRYRAMALSRRVGAGPGRLIAGPLARAAGAIGRRKDRRNVAGRASRFVEALARPPLERNERWLSCFGEEARRAVRAEGGPWPEESEPIGLLRACYTTASPGLSGGPGAADRAADPIAAAMHADLMFTLPDRMLFKLDGATMSVALESRSPFLDTALVEWAAGLPVNVKVDARRGKRVLREAYRDELPREVVAGAKAGFGLPVDHWLRGPLRPMTGDLLGGRGLRERGWLSPRGVSDLLAEHYDGRANHDDRIWALLCLELWFRAFIDRRPDDGDRPGGDVQGSDRRRDAAIGAVRGESARSETGENAS